MAIPVIESNDLEVLQPFSLRVKQIDDPVSRKWLPGDDRESPPPTPEILPWSRFHYTILYLVKRDGVFFWYWFHVWVYIT